MDTRLTFLSDIFLIKYIKSWILFAKQQQQQQQRLQQKLDNDTLVTMKNGNAIKLMEQIKV